MVIMDWTHSSEIKELMCGSKVEVTKCSLMAQPLPPPDEPITP